MGYGMQAFADTAADSRATTGAKTTLASSAYAKLREEIILTELAPGTKLKINVLCERFDVALSPIREALSRLAAEGLVEQIDQRGFRVTSLSEADLMDVTKAKCWVNEIGLRQSIAGGGAAWEEAVDLAFYRLARLARAMGHDPLNRPPGWSITHRQFHHALVAGCGSNWIIDCCDQLFDRTERYRNLARKTGRARNAEGDHRAIMKAALARDADSAVKLLNEHYWRTAELSRKALKAVA
jgi:DNA-binding GntR family transcriptional regulator